MTSSAMKTSPELAKVVRWSQYPHDQANDKAEITRMYEAASRFIQSQKWCRSIEEVYVGVVHPGIVGVFLFQISPASTDADRWLWVIVGDLPPAYIASDDCRDPAAALDGYIGEMDEWVDAVENERPVDELIPVNVPATKENAIGLKKRLDFLHQHILCKR
jgi:hypothetical protein